MIHLLCQTVSFEHLYVSDYFQTILSGKLSVDRQSPLSQVAHIETIPFPCAVLSLFFPLFFFFKEATCLYFMWCVCVCSCALELPV